jgi:hypothetical protein
MSESSNGPQLSDADADRMVTMRKAGLTLDEIARVYGITGGDVYAALRKRMPADELGASHTDEPPREVPIRSEPIRDPQHPAEPAPASEPQDAPGPSPARPRRTRRRALIAGFAAAVVIGAGLGVGLALPGAEAKNTGAGSNLPDVNTYTPASQMTDPDGGVCAQLQPDGFCPGDSSPSPAPPPSPVTLINMSGSGIENSAPFTVGEGPVTANYTYDCSSFGMSGNFIADLVLASGGYDDESIANQLGMGGTVTTTVYPEDPGSQYYLEVNSECSWSVTLTQQG